MTDELIFEYIKEYAERPISKLYLENDEYDSAYENVINILLGLEKEDVDLWVWNALNVKEDAYQVDGSNLSDRGKAFIKEYIKAKQTWMKNSVYINRDDTKNILININEDIIGERIVLKPCSVKKGCDLYLSHVASDGDLALYATPENTDTFRVSSLEYNSVIPNAFYVYLKETNEEIGMVSLYNANFKHKRVLKNPHVHYYIYKKYRKQGYAYEAMKLLIDAFFKKELKQYCDTDKKYVFEEKYCEPLCLKLSCNSNNLGSNNLAIKLGFIFEGTDHYYKFMDGVPQHENHYYLDIDTYNKTSK